MSEKRRARAFTLLEVMVAVVILAIIASMATAGYTRYKDRAVIMAEATNLQVAQAALKLYAYDNNSLPGSLSGLKSEYWERAYAQVHNKETASRTWVAFFREWIGEGVAEADPPRGPSWDPNGRYLGSNAWKILTCPSDRTPPPDGISYALDPFFFNLSRANFELPANLQKTLIFESDDGSAKVYRHGGNRICLTITAGGQVIHEARSGTPNPS